MGLALILIGLIVALFFSLTIGLVLMVIGAILFFVPAAPYGYSSWHGRRGPP
jgi:hypothetical protein